MSAAPAIEANDLSKQFGQRRAVQAASFRLERGQVLGLVGPNGAGKTTLMRMLVGLIRPTSGAVRLFGHDVGREFEAALSSVGAIIETPDMYKFLTGRQNLAQYARMRTNVSAERIAETVRFVDLTDRIDERITRYSLGMRQRLGIAQALLHRPDLLILDEPTNGLDPAGMQDMRKMIRHLADERGMAVLVSSHLLHDVQAVCDTVAVLKEGRMIAAGDIASFLRTGRAAFRFAVGDVARASAIATEHGWRVRAGAGGDGAFVADSEQPPDALNELLVRAGVRVSRIEAVQHTLEEAFLRLTGAEGSSDEPPDEPDDRAGL